MGLFVRALSVYGFTTLQITALRLISADIMFVVFVLLYDKSLFKISLRDALMFIVMGVFGILAMSWLYFSSIMQVDLSVASILLNTAPVWVLLASILFYGERLNTAKVFALLLAVGGCILISGFSAKSLPLFGILCGFGSGIAYALYSIIGKYALKKYSPITVAMYAFVFAGIGSIFICGISDMTEIVVSDFDFLMLIKILGIGFFSVFVPYLLYNIGLSKIPAGKASIMASVEPMMATVSGIFVYRELPSIIGMIGICMIIAAIVLLNLKKQ